MWSEYIVIFNSGFIRHIFQPKYVPYNGHVTMANLIESLFLDMCWVRAQNMSSG